MRNQTRNLLFILLFAALGFMSSCVSNNTHKKKVANVESYRTHDDNSNDWIYWYILTSNNGGYYYYSSPTPVTNYSSITYTYSQASPIADKPATEVENLGTEEVDVSSIPEDVLANVEYEEVTVDEAGNELAEAETSESDNNGDNDTGTDSEASSDAGDSGSDSGGSDSGGGDGGGGGE